MGNRIKFSSSFKKSYEKHIKTNPILQRKFEEKQELEVLIKKFLVEERREEIHQNFLKSKNEDLTSYTDINNLLTDLNK